MAVEERTNTAHCGLNVSLILLKSLQHAGEELGLSAQEIAQSIS
jgi:hypothetical protein